MSFADDLTSMFDGPFGVSCTAGSITANGVLSQPSQVAVDGMVLFTDYMLRAKNSDFGTLIAGDSITVDSVAYTVRETRLMNDGLEIEIALQKT